MQELKLMSDPACRDLCNDLGNKTTCTGAIVHVCSTATVCIVVLGQACTVRFSCRSYDRSARTIAIVDFY